MKLNVVPLIANIIGIVVHIFFCWFFVDYYQFDIAGIGLAGIVTNTLIFVILYVYTISLP